MSGTLLTALLCLAPVAQAQQAASSPAPNRQALAKVPVGSGWADLTPVQQGALQPLGPFWSSISTGQKRKWIALSQNFQKLSPAERTTLHSRMTEWVNLSPVQRSQARLNFAQTQQLSTDEKKAEWQAYQALSLEQRQHLATSGPVLPGGAAPALKPVDSHKLATVPVTRSEVAAPPKAPVKPRPPKEPVNASRPATAASAASPSPSP